MSQALAGSGLELLAPLRVLGQVVSLCVACSSLPLPVSRASGASILQGFQP